MRCIPHTVAVSRLLNKDLFSLSADIQHLAREKIIIQGFNSNSGQALVDCAPYSNGRPQIRNKVYIINADTSYKALLGRPWLYDYNIVFYFASMYEIGKGWRREQNQWRCSILQRP